MVATGVCVIEQRLQRLAPHLQRQLVAGVERHSRNNGGSKHSQQVNAKADDKGHRQAAQATEATASLACALANCRLVCNMLLL